jgi:hypothetical protein
LAKLLEKKRYFLNIMKNLKIFVILSNNVKNKTSIRIGNLTYISDPDFIDNIFKMKFNQ